MFPSLELHRLQMVATISWRFFVATNLRPHRGTVGGQRAGRSVPADGPLCRNASVHWFVSQTRHMGLPCRETARGGLVGQLIGMYGGPMECLGIYSA